MQIKFFGALLALSLVSACGGTPTSAEGEAERTVADSQSVVVASLEVQGMQYAFVDSGHDVGIGLSITGPESAGRPRVYDLFEQFGDLTMLEVYLALAPEGATPDERLVAAHDAEAKAMGRADNEVKMVRLDPEAVIEKGSQTNCRNWATFKRAAGPATTSGTTAFDDATLTQPSNMQVTGKIAASVCNTSWGSSDSGLAANVDMQIGTGAWVQVGATADTGNIFILPANANANNSNTYTHIQPASSPAHRLRVNGIFLGAGHIYYMAIAY